MGKRTAKVIGPELSKLGNDISDLISSALARGISINQAVCITVQVAADYGRGKYGNDYLKALAELIVERGNEPMPEEERVGSA